VVLAAALVAASATAVDLAVTRSGTADTAAHGPAPALAAKADPPSDSAALAAATASRQQAAAWIAAQAGRSIIVSCDPLMCAALQQRGFPAANLSPLGAGTTDPLGSGLVVSTAAVRAELGSRLASVYAPVVLASFGTGAAEVQVRAIAVGGAAAYMAAENADLHAREAAGQQLVHNSNLYGPPAARAQLASGRVDSRLLITLAALTHRYAVHVRGFGDSGPGAAAMAPLRSMTITVPGSAYLSQVRAFLRAQRAPLLALTTVSRAGKVTVLTIEFTAPSPPGLLSQN
jgi:hypothetical protein